MIIGNEFISGYEYILVALAAVGAGFVNALAGGGTLITFPTLTFLGVPPLIANITNTVALLPGYIGGTLGQKKDLVGQGKRLQAFIPVGLLGGLAGGFLLLQTGEKLFSQLVPWLILLASGLLAIQAPMRSWLVQRAERRGKDHSSIAGAIFPLFLASIYGGYFGAGMSVIILAALGLFIDDTLTRLNGLKQAISLSVNVAAATFFLFSGRIIWSVALVMMIGALIGGGLGGRLASRIRPDVLRWIVVTFGFAIGLIYLFK